MNKYREAWEWICKKCKIDKIKFDSMIGNEMVSRIEELVDLEEPYPVKQKEFDNGEFGVYYPTCNRGLAQIWKMKKCPECGQVLDWSKYHE